MLPVPRFPASRSLSKIRIPASRLIRNMNASDIPAIDASCRRNGDTTFGYHRAREHDALWRWQVVPERGPRALDRLGVQQPPEIRSRAVEWRVEFPRLPAGRLESCAAVPVGAVGE